MYSGTRHQILSLSWTKKVLRQGEAHCYIEEMIKECQKETSEMVIGFNQLKYLPTLVRDIPIISKSKEDPEKIVRLWNTNLEKYNIKFIKLKIKIMVIGQYEKYIPTN